MQSSRIRIELRRLRIAAADMTTCYPGLRQLTLSKATFWFIADETSGLIRILAVFFGAQDQQRRMLIRLLERRHDR